jgi:ABC-type sulfate transport system substrate-binding protein
VRDSPEAQGRWGKFRIVYPEYNMWSENPYYIMDAPWVSSEQRKAAQNFLDFISQNSEQQKALNHGFRPADTTIPLRVPGSPFMQYQDLGLQIQIGTTCEYPTPEALAMLVESWKS